MEERERGEGHSGGQICIIRQMNMSHECLKQTHGSFSTSVCVYSFNKKTYLMFYTYNKNCCDGNSCVHEYCEDKKKVYLQKMNKFLSSPLSIHVSMSCHVIEKYLVISQYSIQHYIQASRWGPDVGPRWVELGLSKWGPASFVLSFHEGPTWVSPDETMK